MRSTSRWPALLSIWFVACGGDVGIVVAPSDDDDDSGSIAANLDADDDGFDGARDCDDTDPTVYPGAPEVAGDGIDQNCNGADALLGYGHRDDEGTTALVADFIIGNRIEVADALRVTHLGVLVREPFGELRLAVYADDGGRPAALVAQTGPTLATAGVGEIPVIEPVVLEPGLWWVQVVASETVPIGAGPDELVVYTDHDFDAALPDPYGVASDYVGERISLFLTGELPE